MKSQSVQKVRNRSGEINRINLKMARGIVVIYFSRIGSAAASTPEGTPGQRCQGDRFVYKI